MRVRHAGAPEGRLPGLEERGRCPATSRGLGVPASPAQPSGAMLLCRLEGRVRDELERGEGVKSC